MTDLNRRSEHGMALFLSVFALMLLTGIAAALILMANTENTVNSNYRNEQTAYFSAKAGIEEARARMMTSDPNSISASLPTTAPTTTNAGIIYIVNNGAVANSVQPWTATNAYVDDELCHDGYSLGLTAVAPDVRCNTNNGNIMLPATTTWYATPVNSTLPFHGTAAAVPYKWARIAPKLNGSVSYLTGSGGTATTTYYTVNNSNSVSFPATDPICYDGTEEVPLGTGKTACSQMLSAANAPMTPVYLVTSLGVSSNGARKMVQSEMALQPTAPFPYGLYATSTACPAIQFNGSNPSTDSYTTAGGQTYSSSHTATGGDIGANGEVAVGNGQIGGTIGVMAPGTNCATPVTEGPQGSMLGTVACPTGIAGSCYIPQPYTFPTPPAPNPMTPNTTYNPPSCGGRGNSGNCMTAGTYGNITVNGTLKLAPGVYNINSISMQGNGAIVVSPPGAVTINIGGNGQSAPLAIAGNGITDDTIPNDFTINYAGNGSISIAGNGDVTAILDAPNATLTQQGNGNWYGSMVASQMTIGGNAFFHFDRNAALAPNNNGYYTMISYRLVPY